MVSEKKQDKIDSDTIDNDNNLDPQIHRMDKSAEGSRKSIIDPKLQDTDNVQKSISVDDREQGFVRSGKRQVSKSLSRVTSMPRNVVKPVHSIVSQAVKLPLNAEKKVLQLARSVSNRDTLDYKQENDQTEEDDNEKSFENSIDTFLNKDNDESDYVPTTELYPVYTIVDTERLEGYNDKDNITDISKFTKNRKLKNADTVDKFKNLDELLRYPSNEKVKIGEDKEKQAFKRNNDNDQKRTLFKLPSLEDSQTLEDGISRMRATSRAVSNVPRKFTTTSTNKIKNTINTISPMMSNKRDDNTIQNDSMEGVSRSFAEYLTTASMFAGFQDIEDQNNEVESIRDEHRHHDCSIESAVSCGPENESELTALDSDDNPVTSDNEFDSYLYEETRASNEDNENKSSSSHSTIHLPHDIHETIKASNLRIKPQRNLSKFEISVVDKMTQTQSDDRSGNSSKKAVAISEKLRKVFEIDPSETFYSYYSCWLMGDVLLQGHIYITDKHILFFAYLPKKNKNEIIKSGALSIKSFHSLRMHRKWIILRNHTFSVYSSSTDLYFPELVIDLRTALRAEIYGIFKTENSLSPVWIKIITENRTHWFQAENHDTAKAWVTILKKHIFSSRNKGDQVAIRIPLQNIIDIELTSVVGMTKNLRIKLIENAETYAIDDYFIMFFANGDKAVSDINTVLQNADIQLSNSFQGDTKDLKNSELFKSKIEELKKSSSVVRSTNFRPKEKKKKFREFRDLILSSDEEDDSSPYDYDDSDDSGFESSDEQNNKLTSIGEILSDFPDDVSKLVKKPSKILVPSRFRNQPKPSRNESIELSPSVSGSPSPLPKEDTEKKWSTRSLVQGIQSLIFSGPPLHFDDTLSVSKEGQDPYFVKSEKTRDSCQNRFIKRFSLNDSERLLATYHLYLMRGLPIYGKMYIGTNQICFRSTIVGSNTVMILPITDIENVKKESGFRFGYYGLVVIIRGHEELFFEFPSIEARDDCEIQIMKRLDLFKKSSSSDSLSYPKYNSELASSALSLDSAKLKMFESKLNSETGLNIPIIVEDNPLLKTRLKPTKSYRFTLLTIGSRGDVQPYISLGKALLKEGHQVKIVTHAEFKDWVLSYGIDFDRVAGDPSELMALMVSNPTINYTFIKEAKAKFRGWIDELLMSSWEACQDCDVLIESPSSIGGIHIAEKLQIPYFRAFTMPWTRTRAYPHAFLVPDQKLGGAYNYMTHVAFENGYWRGTCYQINKWRVETLKLHKTSLAAMHQNNVPFLYNMSPVVFPPSVDFPDWVKVTGYWFLDESEKYEPSESLRNFIKKARTENKKLVYIGFGSIVVEDPKKLTEDVVNAVLESDVRCILNKGWSDRLGSKDKNKIEVELPEEVFNSGNVPHDWLFTQIDAAVHHGGSGTTGASLRFGLPTIIKPFFGDQKFYAGRVEDLGCGIGLKSLESKVLAKALKEVTTNKRIIEKARVVGEQIRSENGVQKALDSIYVMMEYAKNLSVSKHKHIDAEEHSDDQDDDDIGEMDGSWLLV